MQDDERKEKLEDVSIHTHNVGVVAQYALPISTIFACLSCFFNYFQHPLASEISIKIATVIMEFLILVYFVTLLLPSRKRLPGKPITLLTFFLYVVFNTLIFLFAKKWID